jgi:hypothetical protein
MVRTLAPQIWKLRVEDQPSGRPSLVVRTREALYGNYLQRTYDRPEYSVSPSERALKQERFSAKISKIMVAQLSVRTAQVRRPDNIRTYYCSRPFEPSAYK